jgi:hypothetical protein
VAARETSSIARIVWKAPGAPAFHVLIRVARKEARARGTPEVRMDPRTLTPRDIEACRNPNNRKSAKS